MSAVTAGSVTVNPDATHTGSGLALALYEGKRAAYLAQWSLLGVTVSDPLKLQIFSFIALQANEEATRTAPLMAAP